jgi:tRNA A-37 threonylcarbamoyl transferase component Bud32
MGSVFAVEQLSTGAKRALKLMRPELVVDQTMRDRFLLEARIGSRIDSDHVVSVIASGIEANGWVPWLVMELLVGEDLEVRVKRLGPRPFAEAALIGKQLAHALSRAHRVGVVHRDLKPGNLFLAVPRSANAEFHLKILDFGIAKLVTELQSSATMGLGTPLWMAPEQSERQAHVGPGTDLWAVGLIMFYLLTGRPYWRAASDAGSGMHTLLRELLFEPIVPPSQRALELGVGSLIPPAFDAWFLRLVERDPARREVDIERAMAGFSALGQAMNPALMASPTGGPTPMTQAWAHQPSGPQLPTGASADQTPAASPAQAPAAPSNRRMLLLGGAAAALTLVLGLGLANRNRTKKQSRSNNADDDDKEPPRKKRPAKSICAELEELHNRSQTARGRLAVDEPDFQAIAGDFERIAKDLKRVATDFEEDWGEEASRDYLAMARMIRGMAAGNTLDEKVNERILELEEEAVDRCHAPEAPEGTPPEPAQEPEPAY